MARLLHESEKKSGRAIKYYCTVLPFALISSCTHFVEETWFQQFASSPSLLHTWPLACNTSYYLPGEKKMREAKHVGALQAFFARSLSKVFLARFMNAYGITRCVLAYASLHIVTLLDCQFLSKSKLLYTLKEITSKKEKYLSLSSSVRNSATG